MTFNLGAELGTTNAATSYGSGGWTPAAHSLVIVFVVTTLGASPIDPTTVTGHGVSYTKLNLSASLLSTTHKVSVWVADVGASPTITQDLADFSGVSQTGATVIAIECRGWDTSLSPTAAIIQAVTTTGTATSVTATNLLAAAANAANQSLAFWLHLANENTNPTPNWFVIGASANFNTPPTSAVAEFFISGFDRSPAASWTTSSLYRVVALEVAASLGQPAARRDGLVPFSAGNPSVGHDSVRIM